jgi:membrane protein
VNHRIFNDGSDGAQRGDSRRKLLAQAIRCFKEEELLVQVSAISFRVVIAILPVTLFVVALLGALQLEDLWREEALPELRENVSTPVYTIVDDAVSRVLERETTYWVTIGAVLAVFSMASIVDAVTRTLNRIHGIDDERSFLDRTTNAAAIGTATGILLLVGIAIVRIGPFAFDAVLGDGLLVEVLSFVVRWGLAAAILVAAVTLMVRVAPDAERPLRRVGLGATITVGGWIVASLAFGAYLEYVAVYDSIFGQLATLYIGIQYVALSVFVYVGGLVIDAVAISERRPRAEG